MFRKFSNFWRILFASIKTAYNKSFKEPIKHIAQDWRDIDKRNLVVTCINKLSNLALTEATFDLITDSVIADPLIGLCKDLEDKRYEIVENMLGDGDYWVFPAMDNRGGMYHTYLTQQQVRILNMNGEEITEAYGIIDWYVDSDLGRTYFLLRHHVLDDNGTLTVSYSVEDETGRPGIVAHWNYLDGQVVQYTNANHIGFARFKSPVSSRGLSPVYGVPINFGCAELEEQIFKDFKMESDEVKNAASKIFTDPRNLKRDDVTGEYNFADNIFAIQQRAGQAGANIDVYAPPVRFADFNEKTKADLRQYEQQIGLDRGFVTDFDTGTAVTATEIRRANASTISMIDKVHNAVEQGVDDTMKADGVFLNIAPDTYVIKIDWYDAFDDSTAQWQRLLDAHGVGAAETEDLTRWLFPDLSAEEIEEKIMRIGEKSQSNTDIALENILNGA